jgi:hypothetical protein
MSSGRHIFEKELNEYENTAQNDQNANPGGIFTPEDGPKMRKYRPERPNCESRRYFYAGGRAENEKIPPRTTKLRI